MPNKEKDVQKERKLIAKFNAWFDNAKSNYANDFKRMRVLDMTDRGELWRAIGSKYPSYQILPDTNYCMSATRYNEIISLGSKTASTMILGLQEIAESIK